MPDDTSPVVLRPDRAQYLRWVGRPDPTILGLLAVLVVGPLLAAAVTGSGGRLLLVLGLIVTGVVLGLGGALLSMRTSAVTLTADAIEHRRWFVRRTVLSLHDELRGVLAQYCPPVSQRSSDLLVVQRADGAGPRVRLNGAFWRHDDLVLIARRAGIAVETGTWRVGQYEKRAPGIMRPIERHWIAFLTVGPLVLVASIVAALGVASARGWLPAPEVSQRTVARQDRLLTELTRTIDAPWDRREATVDDCDDGVVRRVSASARSSLAPDQVAEVAARAAAVLDAAGLTDVEVGDGDELDVRGQEPEAGFDGPSASLRQSGALLLIELDSGCESGD